MQNPGGHWWQTVLPLLVIGIVMALRMRGMSKERPLKIATLWIVPAIYLLLVAVMLAAMPPPLAGWAILLSTLLIGAALGWQRGKLMRIRVDPATGTVWQKSSPAAMLLLIGVVVLRQFARQAFPADPHAGSAAILATDALLGFALGLLSFTRIEMGLRARRLLGERAATA